MTNLEKLQKIASFRIDMSVDVKFDNGDIEHHEYETIRDLFPEYFAEIETALKDYEKIKFDYHELRTYHYDLLKENEGLHNQKVKKLKALEIIVTKKVDVEMLLYYLKTNACDDSILSWYNEYGVDFNSERTLTEEEYNILKEILK